MNVKNLWIAARIAVVLCGGQGMLAMGVVATNEGHPTLLSKKLAFGDFITAKNLLQQVDPRVAA